MAVSENDLLAPEFLRKLDLLSIAAKRAFAGHMKGLKRSPKRGVSVEFADFRDYTPGDDPRYIDWNVYARLEKLFLKLFVEEEDLQVALLIDSSKSMSFGEPSKLGYARKAAAALGYVGLAAGDRVCLARFSDELRLLSPAFVGKQSAVRLFADLTRLTGEGGTKFGAPFRRYVASARRRGVAFLLSDFLSSDWELGVKALIYGGFQIACVHILSPQEISPELVGDLRLLDSETGEAQEVSVSASLMGRYRRALESFRSSVRETCFRYGADYFFCSTADPFEDLVLEYMRAAGVVR
jgi:uncharacterized protein (DUF58 family)